MAVQAVTVTPTAQDVITKGHSGPGVVAIYNDTNSTIYVAVGQTVSDTVFTLKLAVGDYWESAALSRRRISVCSATGVTPTGKLMVTT